VEAHATATFAISGWDESVYDEPAEGPKLARVVVRKTFSGDLEAESVAELLTCVASDGGAGYLASERITGRLGERAGTFVVQHGGIQDGTVATPFGHVVPGSGTGDLTGLRGVAEYQHDEQGAIFRLRYEFVDSDRAAAEPAHPASTP
jgi:hypothetical protein